NYDGTNDQVLQTDVNQPNWSVVFYVFDNTWVAMANPYKISPLTILGPGNIPQIDRIDLAEVGTRVQIPPGGNTYVTLQTPATYHAAQPTVPVFTLWDNRTGGTTKQFIGVYQGAALTAVSVFQQQFYIPLGTTNYQVAIAPGSWGSSLTPKAWAVLSIN